MKFSSRLDKLGGEIFASLNNRKLELEKQGRTVWNMSVGTPDFEPPEHIRRALLYGRQVRPMEELCTN